MDRARIERPRRLHAEAFNDRFCRVLPLRGGRELPSYLARTGIPLAIATSSGMGTAGRILRSLEIGLAGIPIITRDVVAYDKSYPDLFLAAAEALKVTSRPHALSATAFGTSWPPAAQGHSASGSYPEGTTRTSRSAAALIASNEDPADLLRHIDEVGDRV